MISKYKIILLIIIIIFGLLLNYEYEEENSNRFIFPTIINPHLAFIPLCGNNSSFFSQANLWGYPFPYWYKNEFNLKFLIFDLIFYFLVWLIINFILWFINAFKKFQKRKIKPPKFNF